MTPYDDSTSDERKYDWSHWRGVVDTRLAGIESALARIEQAITKRQDADATRVEDLEKKVHELEERVHSVKRYAWLLVGIAGLAGALIERLIMWLTP